eukprot:CAMPEP_0116872816 /NCGR_PEP_ID=MMETSP0463-20121206/3705_1 /TAXON_ID=181622 /ORGANISM="Strombidinopsis sp, Strain SopsisLIS2011" /LENGTH=32 /DNA_ID= /DNA_START= /DNA_END= /DNA_ORIENTATION=
MHESKAEVKIILKLILKRENLIQKIEDICTND